MYQKWANFAMYLGSWGSAFLAYRGKIVYFIFQIFLKIFADRDMPAINLSRIPLVLRSRVRGFVSPRLKFLFHPLFVYKSCVKISSVWFLSKNNWSLTHGIEEHTGCLTISVKSETPLFSDIYRCSRLSFHVVIGHCAGFDFLKKNEKFFFWSGSGPGTSPVWFSG